MKMQKMEITRRMYEAGALAVVRAETLERASEIAEGCIKGGVIALALIAVYFAGYLNPDLMVVEVSGQTVNLMTAVSLVMLAAFTAYAVDVIGKLKDMLLTATPGTDQTPAALPEEKTDEAPDAPKEE